MSVTLLFTDGVGIGLPAPRNNPLAGGRYLLSQFADGTGEPLPDPGRVYPLDTTFGVNGRPQSASNQTALFTGLPAPALLGRHVLGYPNAELRQLLERHSVVKALTSRGRRVAFANGYPAAYLDALGLKRTPSAGGELAIPPAQARRLRPSASTLAMAAGAVTLRTWEDVRSGRALTHDVDGQHARAKGLPLPHRSAEEAADIFWAVAREEDFTLFEHYLADEAAH
ncbi:MAG TPA: metalloenzyme, partial [Myxococcaceae bacterium]|nr:metalloenzyme [Myxococcaceae bacterium]